jgi:hypothetical protein
LEASESPRDLWGLLEWLARYPSQAPMNGEDSPPASGEVVMVTSSGDPALIEAVDEARRRGTRVRGWVIGDAELDIDAPMERVGTAWPV